jgi:NAD dependent epimerase/dehydratase family enzyme
MRVFVTGATGFIGRALAAALVQDGHQVSALTRGEGAGLPPGVRPVRGDPSLPGDWQEVLAPSLVRTPPAALRAVLGELASALTASQRVIPRSALAFGYRFRLPALEPALAELLG